MIVSDELKSMADRMFSAELLESALAEYRREMEREKTDMDEREYDEGAKALSAALDEEQKNELLRMETLCMENVKYALRFGFKRGAYVGFEQFFVRETTDTPFHSFAADELLKLPNMERYREFSARSNEIGDLYDALTGWLDEEACGHLTSVYSGWDGRIYGVLRHGFYLGYRWALAVVEQVAPGARITMTPKILLTEHELDLTRTVEEREKRAARG